MSPLLARLGKIVFVIVLLVVVAYFALHAIPGAERPTLRPPASHGGSR